MFAGVFVRELQRCLQARLLSSVYVDYDSSDDLFDNDSRRQVYKCALLLLASARVQLFACVS